MGAAVSLADAAITAGYAETIVVYRSLAQGQFHRYGRPRGGRRAGGAGAYTVPYGMLSPAQICAMQTTRFMHEHGVTQDSLAEVVLACYFHAQRNPRAIRYGTPLTAEEYHASRWIAEPFHLYDCCPENDGAAAIVVTTAERARDLAKVPVSIVAAAHGLQHRGGVPAFAEPNFPTAYHKEVGQQLWQRAGAGPADVQVAQFYENFSRPGADGHGRDGLLRARGAGRLRRAAAGCAGPTAGCRSTPAAATSGRPTSTASGTSSRPCARCGASPPARWPMSS